MKTITTNNIDQQWSTCKLPSWLPAVLLYDFLSCMCRECHSRCRSNSCCHFSWFIIEDVGRKEPRSGGVWVFVLCQDRCATWCKCGIWCAVWAARPNAVCVGVNSVCLLADDCCGDHREGQGRCEEIWDLVQWQGGSVCGSGKGSEKVERWQVKCRLNIVPHS